MLEQASLKNFWLGLWAATQQCPCATAHEESLHSPGCAPVEIVGGIIAVSEPRRNRRDPLMQVVGQCHKNMHDSRR